MDIQEIIANTADGILVIGSDGAIQYSNEAFARITGQALSVEDKYIHIMAADTDSRNDAFHQVILDAVYHPEQLVKESLSYYRQDGQKLYLQVRAKASEGSVIFTVTDVTDMEEARLQQRDAALLTAMTIGFFCIWIYITRFWSVFVGQTASLSYILSYALIVLGGVLSFFCIRYTRMSVRNMGLRVQNWRAIIIDSILSAAFFLLACLVKLIMLRVDPGFFKTEAFLDWSVFAIFSISIYPISVVGQEFLARGCIQEGFRIIFKGKHQKLYSLIVSSLFFGALHVHKTLPYMIVTPIFMFVCGLIYEKQKNIWGICILHYVLLITCKLLGFF